MLEQGIKIILIYLFLNSNSLNASYSQNADLLNEWKKADNQLYKISVKETELTNQKLQLEVALNETTENIKNLSDKIVTKRDYIINRIRYINQESGSDFLRNFIESANPGQLDRNMRIYLAATQSDIDLIQQYNHDISKLESEKKKYTYRIEKLNNLKVSLQNQYNNHVRELKKKNELLDKIKSKIKSNSNVWKNELKIAIQNNNKDKIRLYQSLLNKSLLDRKGQLSPPSDFKVKYGFGVIKFNPSAPTLPFHGLLYESPYGSPVKAIADGSVVWLGKIDGLGDTIILDHGRDIHSLYSRVTLANLHIGDMIEEGTPFSRVVKASQFIGDGLYFELREHGQPTNPLRWILSKPEFFPKDSNALEKVQ